MQWINVVYNHSPVFAIIFVALFSAHGITLGTVEIKPELQQGLQNIEDFSHLFLIYYFHQARGYDLLTKPFLDAIYTGANGAAVPPLKVAVLYEEDSFGENAAVVRARICEGLGFLGIEVEQRRNAANELVISTAEGRVTVRVIHTDEERMIVETVLHVLNLG